MQGVRIAPRIILIFLPIVIVPLGFLTYLSTRAARDGIGEVATNLLRFKTEELLRYCDSQYRLLSENGLEGAPEYAAVVREAVASYARGLVRDPGELVVALTRDGGLSFASGEIEPTAEDLAALAAAAEGGEGWREFSAFGGDRVSFVAFYPPFGWTLFVSELRATFFRPVSRIAFQFLAVGLASVAIAAALLVLLAALITDPLRRVVRTMRLVVETGELSHRVTLPYDDELGVLGDTFNAMTGSLEQAYGELKKYALETAVAHKREAKIRNIFQKYVPQQVIDRFFESPESMLLGEDRELAIMFSDIRGFTSYSEKLSSREVVASLNDYFGRMVNAVEGRSGIVDKYIGDAIMAFFGAPAPDDRCCYHAVAAAFDMLDELERFNVDQTARGRKALAIGIGINYGSVTIGNIGSEKKMDYTVIGDMVNLASRLEGLTKYYREPVIISEPVRALVASDFPCRPIDRVQVKGRTRGVAIYSVRKGLSAAEESLWKAHGEALSRYYGRDFAGAAELFGRLVRDAPADPIAPIYLDRARAFAASPPPADWTGVTAHTEK
jgi:class 3 adenylate cyclase/HAMP domain-containing protein